MKQTQKTTHAIKKVKVRNMENSNGNAARNQFTIEVEGEGVYFQSYGSIIAFEPYGSEGKTLLDGHYWDDYSVTTSRYRNVFLNESKEETQRKIDQGVYELANLN